MILGHDYPGWRLLSQPYPGLSFHPFRTSVNLAMRGGREHRLPNFGSARDIFYRAKAGYEVTRTDAAIRREGHHA